jgi:hypothetical protein
MKAIETREEMSKRIHKGTELLMAYRGKIIHKGEAKKLYKLTTGGYCIQEERLNDNMTLVVMYKVQGGGGMQWDEDSAEYSYDVNEEDKSIFLVKGKIGKKLNMSD